MNYLQEITTNKTIFFNFMKEKYEVHKDSNIFLRDILYAIMSYYAKKDIKVKYSAAEKIALELVTQLEKENDLKKVGTNAWKVNFSLAKNVIE